MSPLSYAIGVAAALLTLVFVVELLRRRRLRERHAGWWITAGILALVVSVFPQTLDWAAGLVGVAVPINLVFFVSIAILVLVALQHSSELTKVESHVRDLAEEVALLRLELDNRDNGCPHDANPERDRTS